MKKEHGATILVVEDDPLLSDNIALILRMEGYQVWVAADGRQGLELLRQKTPDLILCDILMPEIDGYDFHKQVKEIDGLAGIPFIFISALNDHHHLRRGMQAGADDYLCKPFTAEELVVSVAIRLRRFAAMAAATVAAPLGDQELRALRSVSRRELQILFMVAAGATSREISQQLYISPKTVEVHRSKLMKKLGATNAASLANWAKLAEHAVRKKLIGVHWEDEEAGESSGEARGDRSQ
jgi:DNA-binding NarL/FixJ family response regulator